MLEMEVEEGREKAMERRRQQQEEVMMKAAETLKQAQDVFEQAIEAEQRSTQECIESASLIGAPPENFDFWNPFNTIN